MASCVPDGGETTGVLDREDHAPAFVAQDEALRGSLEDADEAGWQLTEVFEAAEPYLRSGLRFDADGEFDIEVRGSVDGETFGPWQPATITFSEGIAHNAHTDFDEPQSYVQARVRFEDPEAFRFLAIDTLTVEDEPIDDAAIQTAGQGLAADGVAVSRGAWGARATRCSSRHRPNRISIHHTVTPNNDSMSMAARVRQIQSYHMNTRGWCDVGYHFLVGQDGRVYQARPENLIGAHVANQNTNNAGVSFIGEFTNTVPSNAMLNAGARIVGSLSRTYGISLDRNRVKGHREQGSTACPGNQLYARLSDLINRARGVTTPPPAPPPPPPPPTPMASCGTLGVNHRLLRGQSMPSCSGPYRLVHQSDGNVVLYHGSTARWSTTTHGRATTMFVMQADGNLVLYNGSTPLWSSGTHGRYNSTLAVQGDGNVVIYAPGARAIWSMGTARPAPPPPPTNCGRVAAGAALAPGATVRSCDGRFLFAHQTDGNVVMYQGARAIWHSGTHGRPTNTLAMQGDGNLVLYSGSTPLFSTGTHGNAGAWLAVQDDGNVVVYSRTNRPLWASNTGGR